jgi:predicted transcriptional regulator
MDAEERDVYDYLKSWREEAVSIREIARRAGGKHKFRETPDWALPVIARMVEKGLIACDHGGRYRIKAPPKNDENQQRWISPQLAKILKASGRNFSENIDLEEDPEQKGPEEKP